MAGNGQGNPPDDLSIFATAIPPMQIDEILEPRLKAIDYSPLLWGGVYLSIQNGKLAFFKVELTRKCIDI